MTDDKSYIIDPLTILCKIALLHFMPEKTKLAIFHHVLYVDDYSCYQWLQRTIRGDSRIDMSNLNISLLKGIKWYILDGDEKINMKPELEINIKTITKFAIKGFKKLQNHTYATDNAIKIILQYFINLLTDAMGNNWKEETYVKTDISNSILSDKIKNNFDPEIVKAIADILNNADKLESNKDKTEDIAALVNCAHDLLIIRDKSFVKLMKEINTTL